LSFPTATFGPSYATGLNGTHMGAGTLITLIVGAVLGFLCSVVANILKNQINNFLDSSKSVVDERHKRKEQLDYNRLKSLNSGERNASVYFIFRCTIVITLIITGIASLLFYIVFSIYFILTMSGQLKDPLKIDMLYDLFTENQKLLYHTITSTSLIFLSLISLILAVRIFLSLSRDYRRLSNFTKYEEEFIMKFESHASPDDLSN
jgi:hypothetical protein